MTFDASELREIDHLLRLFDRLLYNMNWMPESNPRVRIAVLLKSNPRVRIAVLLKKIKTELRS